MLMRAVIVLLLSATCLLSPSSARLRLVPYTDKELAARGAALYTLMLELARQDAAVSASAFTRLACRTWAFQSLEKLMADAEVKELAPPPHSIGWHDLVWLLLQAERHEDALKILERAALSLDEPDRLFLDVVIRMKLDLSADKSSARLLELVQNPIIAKQLALRWWMPTPPPFRKDRFRMPYKAVSDAQKEIFAKLKPWMDAQARREKKFDTWTMMTSEAAPGQEILIEGVGPAQPVWRAATFSQNRKTLPAGVPRGMMIRESRGGLFRGHVVLGVPRELSSGFAKVVLPKAGEFEFKVVSSPAPAQIRSVFPRRSIPGGWIRLEAVGLQAGRRSAFHVTEKDKEKPEEWPIIALFSQGGQEWKVERKAQIWRGWIQDMLVFRVPVSIAPGEAQLRLKLQDAASEPYDLELTEWPELSGFQRSDRGKDLVAMPASTLTLMFHHPADEIAGLVEQPSGRMKVWAPERAPEPGQVNSESKWRVPKEWEIGIHDVVWAVREGGLWSVPGLFGETLTISPFAAAPENLQATYIRQAEQGSVTTLGANGYESVPYHKGDILIHGEGIETGETYDITVRFAIGNAYSIRRVSSHDYVLMVNVNPTGPAPEYVEVQRVIGGIAGMPARIPIRDYGGVMGDLFTAQTEEGKAAVDWLTEVRSKLRAAQFQDQPSIEKMLWTLRLDTFPLSPWGGQWTYVRTPGHPSLTFLAHDMNGNLRAQFYSGGIGAGLVEYDLLTREEDADTFGVSADNFYWTYPWATNGLGNLVCDAQLSATRADVAVHNTLGLRGNLPAGPLTKDLIEHILPFDNGLVVLHLKGSDFLDLYKEAYLSGKFLYVSGMTVELDSGPGRLDVRFKMGVGKPFSPDAIYRVAMPSYLAEKRAGYPKTAKATQTDDNGQTVREALIDYMRTRRKPLLADRIARVLERFF